MRDVSVAWAAATTAGVAHAFNGSYESPTELADLVSRLAASLSAFPSFRVVFDQVGSFGQREGRQNRYPFVLTGRGDGIAGIGALQSRLAALMPKWVPVVATSTKTPHMTLLYDSRWVATSTVEPVAWTAREFVLVHSLVGKTQHVILQRFPLCGSSS